MLALVIWRWVLLGLLRTPWILGLVLLLALWVPLVEGLRPFPSARGALEVALDGAGPAGLVGASLALAKLSRHAAFLTRVAPSIRWGGEFGALLLAALYLQLPMGLGALAAGARPLDLLSRLPDILTADALLAGTSQLLLVPSLSTAHRALLFLAAAWFLPALCPSGLGVATDLARSLDAAAILRSQSDIWANASLACAIALVGCLLRTRPGSAPSQ